LVPSTTEVDAYCHDFDIGKLNKEIDIAAQPHARRTSRPKEECTSVKQQLNTASSALRPPQRLGDKSDATQLQIEGKQNVTDEVRFKDLRDDVSQLGQDRQFHTSVFHNQARRWRTNSVTGSGKNHVLSDVESLSNICRIQAVGICWKIESVNDPACHR
jgi:hypothetical protein